MTAMNIVHMRVKPGREQEFVALHKALDLTTWTGGHSFWIVKTGERDFCVVGEWESMSAMAGARPQMIASLDRLRPLLEDLGGGRGVTEPWSGDVALKVSPSGDAGNAI